MYIRWVILYWTEHCNLQWHYFSSNREHWSIYIEWTHSYETLSIAWKTKDFFSVAEYMLYQFTLPPSVFFLNRKFCELLLDYRRKLYTYRVFRWVMLHVPPMPIGHCHFMPYLALAKLLFMLRCTKNIASHTSESDEQQCPD